VFDALIRRSPGAPLAILFGAATPLSKIPLGSGDLQLLTGLLYLSAAASAGEEIKRANTISLHPHTSADGGRRGWPMWLLPTGT